MNDYIPEKIIIGSPKCKIIFMLLNYLDFSLLLPVKIFLMTPLLHFLDQFFATFDLISLFIGILIPR